DPSQFFPLLESLGIPYPEISLQHSENSEGWLIKQIGGAGGTHIHNRSHSGISAEGYYFQEIIHGCPMSLVFIANGIETQVLGINETWARAPDEDDYNYAGAITEPQLDKSLVASLEEIVHLLVQQLQLVGLCGLDVIVDDDNQFYVLEINPRPTATFELHEQDKSLFYAHLLACQGQLLPLSDTPAECSGHEVIYADADLNIPQLTWPKWVVDYPSAGDQIATDGPICTILAAARTTGGVREMLEWRKAAIYKQLGFHKVAA
ncbi:MAG: ATP-grasp domain-containing protein, partial [Gammaproteobacteria bacterium]